jgi:hypothetical protein
METNDRDFGACRFSHLPDREALRREPTRVRRGIGGGFLYFLETNPTGKTLIKTTHLTHEMGEQSQQVKT